MSITFFKRYRMHFDLENVIQPLSALPDAYDLVPWIENGVNECQTTSNNDLDRDGLLRAHADAKYLSFRCELDSAVFPCLGDSDGCLRLMREITARKSFLPSGTWLIRYRDPATGKLSNCATIQTIIDVDGIGSIQNVGVVPEHRGKGLGRAILTSALVGMKSVGLTTGSLEVTSENEAAIRLYQKMGFEIQRIVYKPIEVVTNG